MCPRPAYVALLYSLNIVMVFYTPSAIDIILNALAIEFIHQIDEQIASFFDRDRRMLRAGAVEIVLRRSLRLADLNQIIIQQRPLREMRKKEKEQRNDKKEHTETGNPVHGNEGDYELSPNKTNIDETKITDDELASKPNLSLNDDEPEVAPTLGQIRKKESSKRMGERESQAKPSVTCCCDAEEPSESDERKDQIDKFVKGHIKKKPHVFGIAQHAIAAINACFYLCFKFEPLKPSLVCVTLSLRVFRACPHPLPPSALPPPRCTKQVPASQQAPQKGHFGRAPLRCAGAPRCDGLQNKADFYRGSQAVP